MPSASVSGHTSSLLALQEVESGSVDLLITNCHMPDMDGPTLVRAIRQAKKAIPIVRCLADALEPAQDLFIKYHSPSSVAAPPSGPMVAKNIGFPSASRTVSCDSALI